MPIIFQFSAFIYEKSTFCSRNLRQMEIKMHKKIIVCEYCGRILIDPELAGHTEIEAGNVR